MLTYHCSVEDYRSVSEEGFFKTEHSTHLSFLEITRYLSHRFLRGIMYPSPNQTRNHVTSSYRVILRLSRNTSLFGLRLKTERFHDWLWNRNLGLRGHGVKEVEISPRVVSNVLHHSSFTLILKRPTSRPYETKYWYRISCKNGNTKCYFYVDQVLSFDHFSSEE